MRIDGNDAVNAWRGERHAKHRLRAPPFEHYEMRAEPGRSTKVETGILARSNLSQQRKNEYDDQNQTE
jgi:hypothetical protein